MTEKLKFYYLTDDNLPLGQVFTLPEKLGVTLNMFHPDHLQELIEAGSFMFDFVNFREYAKSQDYQAGLLRKSIDFPFKWIKE
jgi:hypothetical protein